MDKTTKNFLSSHNSRKNYFNVVFRPIQGQTEWPPEYRDLFHAGYTLPIKEFLNFDIDIDVEIKEFPISNEALTFLNHAVNIFVQNFDVQDSVYFKLKMYSM